MIAEKKCWGVIIGGDENRGKKSYAVQCQMERKVFFYNNHDAPISLLSSLPPHFQFHFIPSFFLCMLFWIHPAVGKKVPLYIFFCVDVSGIFIYGKNGSSSIIMWKWREKKLHSRRKICFSQLNDVDLP